MAQIEVGLTFSKFLTVESTMSAKSMGSGDMEVFATPSMVAFMENVAMEALAPLLDEGDSTVGIMINTTHSKATPMGGKVKAIAKVTAVDGRKISFEIEAADEYGAIGKATHDRFIVNREKFLSRLK